MGKKSNLKKAGKIKTEQEKLHNETIRQKDWLFLNVILLVSIIGIILMVIFTEIDTRLYDKAQNALFIILLMASISFIVRRAQTNELIRSVKVFFDKSQKISFNDSGNILLTLSYLIAFLSFFLLDLSFFNNYGFKISAVVALAFIRLIRNSLLNRNSENVV